MSCNCRPGLPVGTEHWVNIDKWLSMLIQCWCNVDSTLNWILCPLCVSYISVFPSIPPPPAAPSLLISSIVFLPSYKLTSSMGNCDRTSIPLPHRSITYSYHSSSSSSATSARMRKCLPSYSVNYTSKRCIVLSQVFVRVCMYCVRRTCHQSCAGL